MGMQGSGKKLTLLSLVLMMFTSVFGFYNIPRSYFLMGYAAIPWFLIAAVLFLVPFAFILTEYGTAFKDEEGGIYSWMEKSVSPRYAFISTFMWYAAFLILLVNLSTAIWIPLSNVFFGEDITNQWSLFGLNSTQTIGLLSILWVIAVTVIELKGLRRIVGFTSIGGTAVAMLAVMLLVGAVAIVILNHGEIAQPVGDLESFFRSPNADYATPWAVVSFLVFAIYAYGGIEVVGGLVDKTENPKKTFPKGVIIAATTIALGYSGGIALCGLFTNWSSVLDAENVHIGNAAYVVLQNLGYEFGRAAGLAEAPSVSMGAWVARFTGLGLFLATTGAFFTLSFSPIRQLIAGTPEGIWPGKLGALKDGVPVNALIVQCLTIVTILGLISFAGETASQFFLKIVLMTNVAITVPMIFLAAGYRSFKKNAAIEKPFVVIKTLRSATVAAGVVVGTIVFANVVTIIEPIVNKGDVGTSLWMVSGPIVFSLIAVVLHGRYVRRAG